MKRKVRSTISLLLAVCLILVVAACGNNDNSKNSSATPSNSAAPSSSSSSSAATNDSAQPDPVTLTFPTSWVGAHPFAPYLEQELAKFKEKYPHITVKVEEMPDDAAMEEKLKVLIAANDFPDIAITNSGTTVELADKAGLLVDFKPVIEADPEWKAVIDEKTMDFWGNNSGKWPGVSTHVDSFSYYYNKELFAQAGIQGPAKTWEEFFQNAEALKAQGIAPITLNTAGGGWITSLWFMGLIGSGSDAGNAFANTKNATSYDTPEVLEAASRLKDILTKYTTKDSVGADYTAATNNFFAGKAAMISDGVWLAANFDDPDKAPADFRSKVGIAMFPNDGVFVAPGYVMLASATDPAKQDAVIKFVKFFNDLQGQLTKFEKLDLIPASSAVDVSNIEADSFLLDIINNKNQAKYTFFNNNAVFNASINSIISQEYLALALKDTPEQFIAKLTKAAQE